MTYSETLLAEIQKKIPSCKIKQIPNRQELISFLKEQSALPDKPIYGYSLVSIGNKVIKD